MTLKELQIGKSAVVDTVGGTGALRQHFLDMGLVPGAQVTLIKLAPMGDPMELRIHGYELTLRLDDAAQIGIIPTEKVPAAPALVDDKMVDHPGLGEGGKYHIKKGEHPLPDGTTLTFALAGNQNCGKTTLFNQLTGSNQHVGNFPGVTVDRKSGAIKGHPETEVTDLPGIYSMSPYSSEEIVTRQFIIGEKPTGIINIVDATNIERNLYLTMQLMELDTPMVLALNMMDEMRGNGGTVRINKMESMLGIPVIPISAAKNEAWTSWWTMPCMWQNIRSGPAAWISAVRTTTAARCTAASTASSTSSRITPRRRASRCGLPPPSWWRATTALRKP